MSRPISFWERQDPPIQSYIELETHASAETYTGIKRLNWKNPTKIDYDFNIGDKVMVRKNQAYK